jgi:hypothetical protein
MLVGQGDLMVRYECGADEDRDLARRALVALYARFGFTVAGIRNSKSSTEVQDGILSTFGAGRCSRRYSGEEYRHGPDLARIRVGFYV